MPAGLVTGLLLLVFLGMALATAGPAAAAEDPTRPQARVLQGPSCHPGGMVIDVVARSVPYSVRLATTRRPGGEDQAVVRPGQTVTLRSGPVDWGETIDSRLEYTALDGSGTSYVDELELYSFTRPTQADCAAAAGPPANTPAPSTSSVAGAGQGTDAGAMPAADLRPSASVSRTGDLWALVAAAVALLGTVAALVTVVAQQRASGRPRRA